MTVRIIAEIGENHLGDIERARRMIGLAARSGADFVKFQSFDELDLSPDADATTRAWIRRVQLSAEAHRDLQAEARKAGIRFLSTAVNVRWARFLKEIGCEQVKLASLSLTNQELLRYAGANFREVFLSTGMGDVEEIETAIKLASGGAEISVLHCVSEYPTPDARASLGSLTYLKDRLRLSVGYSDHTIGNLACFAAVAMGAKLIEKHFTEDKTLEGTDHILSADPAEMAELVHGIRRIEKQLGSVTKAPNEIERGRRASVRALFRESP